MRGWFCRLKLLLILASAVILGSESGETTTFYQIRDSTNLEGYVPIFTSPGNRVVQFYPHAHTYIHTYITYTRADYNATKIAYEI
jgi:hypothetical protein